MPQFEVDPSWPALPNDWVLGSVASVDVADDDHVWVYHRPLSVEEDEQANAAPPVLEFDRDGTFIQAWGGPGDGYDWPSNEHGIEVDGQGHVWVGGNNGDPSDDMLLKFTHEGEFVMQIGGRARSGGNTDTENLKRPAEASVYPDTNEVFVADGYGNRRVVVFDADSGEFKRMWGAFENEPIEASDEQPPPDEMLGPQQFGTVHGIEVSNDGLVYVADRDLNRIQVFTIDGSYQTQVFVNKDANANSVAGLAFSPRFGAAVHLRRGPGEQPHPCARPKEAGSTRHVWEPGIGARPVRRRTPHRHRQPGQYLHRGGAGGTPGAEAGVEEHDAGELIGVKP